LDEPARRVHVGGDCAKKESLCARCNEQGGEVFYLYGVYHIGLVFNVNPHEAAVRKFGF
jgi:hypothetical protein